MYCKITCRWHNDKLDTPMRLDFRRLSEKIERETRTGAEKYMHTFEAATPADVEGAKRHIEVFNGQFTMNLL